MSLLDLFDAPADTRDKKTFDPLPAGEYQVEIEGAMIDEANQWGPQLKYTLKITDDTKFRNRKIWVNRKLDAANLWKVRKDLDALGMPEVSSKTVISALQNICNKIAVVKLGYAPNPKNSDKPYQNVEFVSTASEQPVEDSMPF